MMLAEKYASEAPALGARPQIQVRIEIVDEVVPPLAVLRLGKKLKYPRLDHDWLFGECAEREPNGRRCACVVMLGDKVDFQRKQNIRHSRA